MKWVLVVLVSLHGLLHLIGFVTQFGIKTVDGFSGETIVALPEPARKAFGLAWLLVCCLLLAVAAGLIAGGFWWRPVLIPGLVLSQVLIVIWWRDAWAGSIANAAILAMVLAGVGQTT